MRALWLLLCAFALETCRSSVDPEVGRFSCATAEDCGTGWECRPQFAGGGRCFKNGQCSQTETCDGADQNCDGRIDERFPEQDAGCPTGLSGACAPGAKACVAGTLVCAQTVAPTVELCNGVDDNCNGSVDEAFDLTSDAEHCGSCTRACASGTTCRASSCRETTCDDGVDNDQNGTVDCADEACFGLACALVAPPAGRCGLVAVPRDGGVDAGFDDGGVDAGLDGGVDAGFARGCFASERVCDNGLDDDGDGLADCLDPDCDLQRCFSGTTCSNRLCPGPG
jgi:hypothetical protein